MHNPHIVNRFDLNWRFSAVWPFFSSLIMVVHFFFVRWTVDIFFIFKKERKKYNRLSVNGTRWLAILKSKWALNIQIIWVLQYNSHTSVTAFEMKKCTNKPTWNQSHNSYGQMSWFYSVEFISFFAVLKNAPNIYRPSFHEYLFAFVPSIGFVVVFVRDEL